MRMVVNFTDCLRVINSSASTSLLVVSFQQIPSFLSSENFTSQRVIRVPQKLAFDIKKREFLCFSECYRLPRQI
jgi:hypothetical protein